MGLKLSGYNNKEVAALHNDHYTQVRLYCVVKMNDCHLPQVASIVANNVGMLTVSKDGNLLLNDIEVLG